MLSERVVCGRVVCSAWRLYEGGIGMSHGKEVPLEYCGVFSNIIFVPKLFW